MAFLTAEQRATQATLTDMLAGEGLPFPDKVELQDTFESYGLLLLQWCTAFGPDRVMIVKPDGTLIPFSAPSYC